MCSYMFTVWLLYSSPFYSGLYRKEFELALFTSFLFFLSSFILSGNVREAFACDLKRQCHLSLCARLWVWGVTPSTGHLCDVTLSPPNTRPRISWLFCCTRSLVVKAAGTVSCCYNSCCKLRVCLVCVRVCSTDSRAFSGLCNCTCNDRFIVHNKIRPHWREHNFTRTILLLLGQIFLGFERILGCEYRHLQVNQNLILNLNQSRLNN